MGVATDITEKRMLLKEQQRSLSALKATLESTADAILVVDMDYYPVLYNEKFALMMQSVGFENIDTGQMRLAEFAKVTTDPDGFLSRVREIMESGETRAFDSFELQDGRVFERYTQVQLINDEVAGRVWSFRDITHTVKATRALRESEKLYRTILEDNLFPILRVVEGRILSSNRAFSNMTGRSFEELRNSRLHEVLHPGDLAEFMKAETEVMEQQVEARSLTCRVVHKDGSTYHFLASLKAYHDLDDNAVELIVTAADISQLKQIENQLVESEARYRSLVDASPAGILATDVNGVLTYVSNQMKRVMGLDDVSELVGKNILELAVAEEIDRARRDIHRSLSTHEPVFGRYTVQVEDRNKRFVELGARRFDDSTGNPLGLIIVTRDITEQVNAEDELRKSEIKYRTLFESTFDGFVMLDHRGNMIDANPSALNLLGCKDLDQLKALNFNQFFDERDYQSAISPIIRKETNRSKTVRLEGSNMQNEPVYAEIAFSSFGQEGSEMIACAVRDVAERVVLEVKENELRQQEIEVETLNRELTANALYASQKNKLLSDIRDDIDAANSVADSPVKTMLQKVRRKINSNLNDHDDLLAFRLQFEKVHPNFFNKLLGLCPRLTDHELKYCAYIRLNMSTQDICNLLYVEKKSVEMSKYRIKKKLGLDRSQRLGEFLHSI